MDNNTLILVLTIALILFVVVMAVMHFKTYNKFVNNEEGYRPLTRKETELAVQRGVEKGVEKFSLKYNVVSPAEEEEIDLAEVVE